MQADALTDALSSGGRRQGVVHVDDLLEEAAPGRRPFSFGMRSGQIATMAMSSERRFVLQGTASNLLQMRDRVQQGLRYAGRVVQHLLHAPAASGTGLPGYLAAASAMQSRAFPAFSYDPGAGSDLASRFRWKTTRSPNATGRWKRLTYADQDLQCGHRGGRFHIRRLPSVRSRDMRSTLRSCRARLASTGLIPARQWLEKPPRGRHGGRPSHCGRGRRGPALSARG